MRHIIFSHYYETANSFIFINGQIVFYWIAGGVYWSAVVLTNLLVKITGPRCCLLIHDVYQSAAVDYWSAEKNKNSQNGL